MSEKHTDKNWYEKLVKIVSEAEAMIDQEVDGQDLIPETVALHVVYLVDVLETYESEPEELNIELFMFTHFSMLFLIKDLNPIYKEAIDLLKLITEQTEIFSREFVAFDDYYPGKELLN